jgi:hypothetical protein
MGRGLSELQKKILVASLECRGNERIKHVDAYYRELITACFGWEQTGYRLVNVELDSVFVGPKQFKKRDHPNYNAVKVSLTRAVKRLETRGLLICYHGLSSNWAGVKLTQSGEEAAIKANG